MVKNLTKTAVTALAVALMVSLVAPVPAQPTGDAWVEVWSGIGGSNLSDLTGNANYPNNPSSAYTITGVLETPTNWANDYGQRIRGYFWPPQTGEYTFWCVSDDNSELYISTDTDPANAVLVSGTSGWAGARDWNSGNVSPGTATLTMGNAYFFEILHKEGGGGDNLAVGWQLPDSTMNRPIDMSYVEMFPLANGIYSMSSSKGLATYPPAGGTADPIVLTLDGVGPGALTCTETLHVDLTNITPTASAGSASVVGNQIIWTIADLTAVTIPATLSYTVDVPTTACVTDFPISTDYDTGTGLKSIALGPWGSDSGLLGLNYDRGSDTALGAQPSDGLAGSPLDAGGNLFNYNVGWAGDPPFDGDSLYYSCMNGYAVYGSGSDIWRNGDHFQYLCFAVSGDFEIAADVRMVQPFNDWTKAGIMARQNLGSRAIYFLARMRGNNDNRCDAQWRLEENNDNSTSTNSGHLGYGRRFPTVDRARLHLKREGTSVSIGWKDLDGPTSQPVGTWIEMDMPELPNRVLLGFPVTSHDNNWVAWCSYSNVETTVTYSTYAPMIDVPARSFSAASYYPGTPITVSVLVPHLSDGTQITVVETVPDGVSASNISAGGTLNGNTITWVLGGGFTGDATVTYDATITLPQRPVRFVGGYAEDEMLYRQNTPDSTLWPQGITDIFQQGVYPDASYAGCADNHIIENTVLSNQGQWDHAEEGDWFGTTEGSGLDDHKKILVKFDLSSLASGYEAGVAQAFLGLYFDAQRRGGIAHEAHYLSAAPVLKEWVEGTGNGSDGPTAQPGESNWMSAQAGTLDWETSGAMGVTDVGPFEPASWWDAQLNQWVMLDVTQSTKNMIATAGDSDDQGWKVSQDKLRGVYDATVGNEYVRGAYDAASAQNGDPWRRPILILQDATAYQLPASASRTVPSTYQWGVAIPVAIDVIHAGGPGSPLTITEDLPAGLDASNVSNISAGGSVVGNQIVWNIATFTADVQVTYDLTVLEGNLVPTTNGRAHGYAMLPLAIPGGTVTDDAGASLDVGADEIPHAGVILLQDGVYPDSGYDGCQDAHVITYQKDNNTGATNIIEEGDWNGRQDGSGTDDHKKLLVQFDLTGVTIPGGETYQGARLWLYLLRQQRGDAAAGTGMYDPNNANLAPWEHAGNQDHALFVFPLLKAWNEGDKDNRDGILATDNEVTWNYANTTDTVVPTPGVPWEIPGVMGATDVYDATADVGTQYETFTWVDMPTTDSQDIGMWVTFDVSGSVAQFLADPTVNNGWKISQDHEIGIADNDPGNIYEMGAYQFVSSENAQANLRPILEIITDARVPVEVSKFIVW